MSEEESDGTFTDSHEEEEGELPVIQLCGLVEELRYRHHEPLRVSVVPYRPLTSTGSLAGTHRITMEKDFVFAWLTLLLACS